MHTAPMNKGAHESVYLPGILSNASSNLPLHLYKRLINERFRPIHFPKFGTQLFSFMNWKGMWHHSIYPQTPKLFYHCSLHNEITHPLPFFSYLTSAQTASPISRMLKYIIKLEAAQKGIWNTTRTFNFCETNMFSFRFPLIHLNYQYFKWKSSFVYKSHWLNKSYGFK